jgi:hypothetical protein
MSFFNELKRRNVFKVAAAGMHEQGGPSVGHLHVAAQKRRFASLLRSTSLRVGTSLCQGPVMP